MKSNNLKILFTVLAFLYAPFILAQDNSCKCSLVFDDLTQKLESNYIGLAQMKLANGHAGYEKLKAKYKKKTEKAEAYQCTSLLQEFLKFFNDGHLFVFEHPKPLQSAQSDASSTARKQVLSIQALNKLIAAEARATKAAHQITGRWTDGQSEFLITRINNKYKTYVVSSKSESVKPGELIAEFKAGGDSYRGTYFAYNQAPKYTEANIYKEGTLLVLTGGTYWAKVDSPFKRELAMINYTAVNLPTVQKLDEENTLMSIPSYLVENEKFVKVLLDNFSLLSNTTNLIIDIRGNTGGNALYFTFLDAYADKVLSSSQGLVLASEDTRKYFEQQAAQSPDVFKPVVDRIASNMGVIVEGPLYPEKKFKPFNSKIRNVAILTDKGCMSAAESFILHSKGASTKVTTFGSPTAGVIDYTSVNTLRLESGGQQIYFGYPTSTFHKNIPENGYNRGGIKPDVPIDEKVHDKIDFIVQYYKKQKH